MDRAPAYVCLAFTARFPTYPPALSILLNHLNMKLLLLCLLCLAGLATRPLRAQPAARFNAEREQPMPRADAELRALARQQTAALADRLLLSQAKARHLHKALYQKLWQQHVQEEAQPLGQPVPAATSTALLRAYYHRLLSVLSPAQYSTLLQLEGETVAPFAPLAVASRYVPAYRFAGRSRAGQRL
jgi:hypothetical protein